MLNDSDAFFDKGSFNCLFSTIILNLIEGFRNITLIIACCVYEI